MSVARVGQAAAILGIGLIIGAALFVLSGVLLAMPFRRMAAPPPPDLVASDVTIPSRSGSLVHGWMSRGEAGAGTVVLLHGVHADRRARSRACASSAQRDIRCSPLIFRHTVKARAGSSPSAISRRSMPRLPSHSSATRCRVSGSVSSALRLAARPLCSARSRCASMRSSSSPFIPISDRRSPTASLSGSARQPVASLYLGLMPLILHLHEDQLRPIDHIADLTAPLLLMAGTADRYITIEESRSLFERAAGPKRFWPVDGAAHVDLAAYATEAYRAQVLDFFRDHLREVRRDGGLTPR